MAPKIEAHGTGKVYVSRGGRETVALEPTDLSVEQGEFVCLVGPSGCGKSTLLFLFAGLLEPTSGRISIDGSPIAGPDPDRGVVFQPDATFPWMSVADNVAFGPTMRGLPGGEVRGRVDRYLSLVGLAGKGALLPRELSGGMRKRVDVARAFANEPQVLLMDEPFGALDAMTKEHLQDELLRLWEAERKTIIFVTHDLEEALYLGTRIVVMSRDPNAIRAQMTVDLPHPREPLLRTEPRFQELRRNLWLELGGGADDVDGPAAEITA
jgi:NitT/TauT family transport system ATP-binding protein